MNLNFGKQILVSPLWFASLLISLAITLCFRFDLLGGVVFMYAGTRNILDIIYKDTTQSYICARVKEGQNSDCGQVLHRTGLTGCFLFYAVKSWTGLPDRSDRSVC